MKKKELALHNIEELSTVLLMLNTKIRVLKGNLSRQNYGEALKVVNDLEDSPLYKRLVDLKIMNTQQYLECEEKEKEKKNKKVKVKIKFFKETGETNEKN